MNYFFQVFFGKRPELKIEILFTAHTQICIVWGTESYFGKLFNFSCVICGFDHTWKNNYMTKITGTSKVKMMVKRGNIFEPICSPSA